VANTKIFIHGLESSSKGVKARYFKDKFPDMIIPDFIGSFEERMKKLKDVLKGKSNIRIVGSSYGGLMATVFAMEEERVDKLILLAPAINFLNMVVKEPKKIDIPVWIYHGKNDDVIPLNEVRSVAERIFTRLSFNIVDDDHYLHNIFRSIAWEDLLS